MATHRTSIPVSDWPHVDQAAWATAIRTGQIFEKDGLAAGWAAATKRQVAKGYGKWLWALRAMGALDAAQSPAERATRENLRAYLDILEAQGLASETLASRITDVAEAIRVMQPDADQTLLKELAGTLRRRATPSRNKAGRIREPSDIWRACVDEMNNIIEEGQPLKIGDAARYRDAMSLGFLAWSPIRRRNLAALCLGKSVVRQSAGWHVSFRSSDTKDKAPLSFYLPNAEEYQKAFENYLASVRPVLLREARVPASQVCISPGPLWISTRGRAMSEHALYYSITRCSERLLGAPLNPHLLRDCAASSITAERPEYVLAAARVLGHSHLSTTLSHYEHASMLQAGQRLQEVVAEWQANASKRVGPKASEDMLHPFTCWNEEQQ